LRDCVQAGDRLVIEATVIADSIAEHASRLHTQRWRYPKFVHQESLRHRRLYVHDQLALAWDPDFSFSVSSARAIPFKKTLEEVRSDALRAEPVFWGVERRGMSPGEELPDDDSFIGGLSSRQAAKNAWREAALRAADIAESLSLTGSTSRSSIG
jgi:hypothetical protein